MFDFLIKAKIGSKTIFMLLLGCTDLHGSTACAKRMQCFPYYIICEVAHLTDLGDHLTHFVAYKPPHWEKLKSTLKLSKFHCKVHQNASFLINIHLKMHQNVIFFRKRNRCAPSADWITSYHLTPFTTQGKHCSWSL